VIRERVLIKGVDIFSMMEAILNRPVLHL
jgi:hypothetical protein